MNYSMPINALPICWALIHRRDYWAGTHAGYFVNPSDRQHAIELMKDGEVRSYEAQMRKRDGTVFGTFLLI